MIHWIFMIRLSWSCTWSWTPCPRPPPWTSTSSSPPWPLPPPLPRLEHLHSSTLAHNRWLFFWISITRSSSEFLPLCGQDDSLLSWTHTHSPFSLQLSLHLHLDLSIILSLDLFLDPFLDLNNGFGFNIGFFSTFGGERWGRHAKWERSRGSDKYQRTWILPELYNNRM